ncbi:Hypp8277 [Branchiostoma lanceolatum]|uniref:Hypp8277 protein n=1 Tax=Branchiostoma lanceolatum TaxID=7740 RepID=A0A8K0EHH4_BRALA|nr:Hypp8277 [Branchiostoma lanceolatum]
MDVVLTINPPQQGATLKAQVGVGIWTKVPKQIVDTAPTYTNGNINKIVDEKIQRRAARFVLNQHRNNSSVCSMLDQLQWAPLQDRGRSIRLTMLYNIQHGQASVRCDALKPLADSSRRSRRGHNQQLQHINCRTD